MSREEIGYMTVEATKCDCCGEMKVGFSDKTEWFGKYLRQDENRICSDCIKGRDGYAKEFLEKIGVSVEVLNVK